MSAERHTAGLLVCGTILVMPHPAVAQRPGQVERLPPNAPAAVQACVGCHGSQGEGNSGSGTPRIAGQSAHYLAKQLDSYANGSRQNRVMEPIARSLPPEVRVEVARYYAQLAAPVDKRARQERPSERGRVLANEGDNALGVQACRNCHGPEGVGEPPNIPYISGLDANYLRTALNAWREGTRTNDAGQQMFTVVSALPAEDIAAVAQYYAKLPPPRPAPLDIVQAPPREPKVTPRGTAPVVEPGADGRGSAGVEQAAPFGGAPHGKGAADVSKQPPPESRGAGKPFSKPAGPESRKPDGGASADRAKKQRPFGEKPTSKGDPAKGRALVASGAYGCTACHTIPGIRSPRGIVGPPLDGMAGRAFIAGQLPNTPDVLIAFLRDPPALVPETGMPNLGLSFDEARHIAAYLATLNAR